ncbi:MFS transporter [Shewanella nanhaiensis]|uniref:MFS transporter n=1 Tax=Shewanella nanhaiensis TaxID=2864872 RepID=A0ABS7E1A8_9GAMM|nr:MFS transporter [Shewanella nanhaiensis]MBW8183488.1 MFS transporter [Shewanella nanhaiensis]
MPFNVWVLTLAQAFAMSAAPMMMLLGGIIGIELAPEPGLATLPITAMVIGVAISVLPVTQLMRRFGRKPIFISGSILSAIAGLVAAYGTHEKNFVIFCISGILLGVSGAIVQQYRFAAMEAVEPHLGAKAASRVLLGGLVAAFLGPELAVFGSEFVDIPYVGAFMFLTFICLLAAFTLSFYREPNRSNLAHQDLAQSEIRAFGTILNQPKIWVAIAGAMIGFAMMSFVMTATPLHMHHNEHYSLADTKWVIQSHIIAMYLPSLFTGYLVAKWGVTRMMLIGLTAYLVTIVIALAGSELLNYWVALVLLGLGWNLLFVGGTVLLPQCYRVGEGFKVQALNDTLVFGAQALASLSAGWVIHQLGWQLLLNICIPFIALQLLLMAWWRFSESSRASAVE